MKEWIAKYWLEVLFGLLFTGLTAGYRKLSGKLKEQNVVKDGILAILHDRVYQACKCSIARGWCTVEEMKNMEYLYQAYHALGGNGTGTQLYSRVQALPLCSEEKNKPKVP